VTSAGDGSIPLQWRRGDVWILAWLYGLIAAAFFAVTASALGQGMPVAGALLALVGVGAARIARRAIQVLRRSAPELLLLDGGGTELRHPLLIEPLRLAASDVHSVWVGPFEQPPKRGGARGLLVGSPRFPGLVLDTTGRWGPVGQEHAIVVSFTRSLALAPRLRISRWVFACNRMDSPLRHDCAHGLVVRAVDRPTAVAAVQASGTSRSTMPPDVRSWLQGPT
jgi:hypothetical protein